MSYALESGSLGPCPALLLLLLWLLLSSSPPPLPLSSSSSATLNSRPRLLQTKDSMHWLCRSNGMRLSEESHQDSGPPGQRPALSEGRPRVLHPPRLPFPERLCVPHLPMPGALVGFSLLRGGGSIEPPKTGGGVREKGSIDRHHSH